MHMCGANNVGIMLCKQIQHCLLRFSDYGASGMLEVVGSKVCLVSNFVQQLPTTCNREESDCPIVGYYT